MVWNLKSSSSLEANHPALINAMQRGRTQQLQTIPQWTWNLTVTVKVNNWSLNMSHRFSQYFSGICHSEMIFWMIWEWLQVENRYRVILSPQLIQPLRSCFKHSGPQEQTYWKKEAWNILELEKKLRDHLLSQSFNIFTTQRLWSLLLPVVYPVASDWGKLTLETAQSTADLGALTLVHIAHILTKTKSTNTLQTHELPLLWKWKSGYSSFMF